MKFVRQAVKIKILPMVGEKQATGKNGVLFPDSVRAIFIAPSGGGKTTALMSMILSVNGLKFEHLVVYSKSLGQSKYKYLEKVFSGIDEVSYNTYSNNDEIIGVDDTPPHTLIIFDDISMENQDIVRDFFSRGRHRNIDCVYLSQSYFVIPKSLVRENLNYLAIFKQDHFNLLNIYKAHVNTDMTYEEFSKMCAKCWEKEYGFLVINKDEKIHNGRYKLGFDTIIIPESFQHGRRQERKIG